MDGPATASGLRFENVVSGEVAGCAITVDTLRYLPAKSGAANLAYLLGFSGQTSVARAAWANLIAPRCSYLNVEETLYSLADGGKGWEMRTSRVTRGVDEMVLFPPCADRWASVQEMLIVEHHHHTPADTLMRLLEYRSSVPLDAGWSDTIWRWAVEAGAVQDLAGFGPRAWLVHLSDEALLTALPAFVGGAGTNSRAA